MNKRILAGMLFNRQIIRNFWIIFRRFNRNKQFRIVNMIRCGANAIKHDRLAVHDKHVIINSFLPPLDSKAFLNIAIQVPGEGKDFFENHVKGVRKAPISCYIACTDECMYHCWHCSASRFMKDSGVKTEYTTEQLKYAVRMLQKLGVGIIGFTGGEPLLRKDLEEVISTISDQSVSYIFSTGYHLTYERACALKRAGLFGIAISIDSPKEEEHDAMRKYDGAYQEAIKALKSAKRAGLYTMSQTVCTRELMDSGKLFVLAKYLKRIGIDEMRIMEPIPCGSLSKAEDVILNEEEQKKLRKIHIYFNHNKAYPKTSVFPYVESETQFGCGAGVQHSYLDSRGNFGPCDFISKTYGNIFEENIKDIWNRMHTEIGCPHLKCLAKEKGVCGSNKELPRYYQLLGGKCTDVRR